MADCGCGSNCTNTCGNNCMGTNTIGTIKIGNQLVVTRTITKSISGTDIFRVDNLNKNTEVK